LNVKLCTTVFNDLALELDNISVEIDKQLSGFSEKIKNIERLQSQLTDKELLKCLEDYKNNLNESYM